MKLILCLSMLLASFTSMAARELILDECKFTSVMSFKPSPTLSMLLKKEVKGKLVYRVETKQQTRYIVPT